MVSAPAALCLNCPNVEAGVQLIGSPPNQRVVCDSSSSEASVAPVRSVLLDTDPNIHYGSEV